MLDLSLLRRHAPALLMLLAAVWWTCWIRWGGPLTELHDFRQSQTALSAYWMVKDGISLLWPPLPVFGIENIAVPMEFPFYQALTAAFVPLFHSDPVAAVILAGRVINFLFFLLAAWALYRLVLRLHDEMLAVCTLALFLFMPFPVVWSGTVSIEYGALAAQLWYLDLVCRLVFEPRARIRDAIGAAVLGAVAMLFKVTTALAYGPLLLALWIYWLRSRKPSMGSVILVTLLVAVVPLSAGYVWVHWSDMIKAQSPLTYFLTSDGSTEINYGTLAQRLMPQYWAKIANYWGLQIWALVGLPFAILGAVALWRRSPAMLLFWMLPPLTGVCVFFNVYQHHNYYHLAILPGLTVLLAAGLLYAPKRWVPAGMVTRLVVLVLMAWLATGLQSFIPGFRTPRAMLSEFHLGPSTPTEVRARDLVIVDALRSRTRPQDVSFVALDTWSSVVALYAERRVLMSVGCGADLAARPRLDFYLLDTARSICRDLSIPARCRVMDRDGIVAGTCLEVATPAQTR
jgi:hypothetical protein